MAKIYPFGSLEVVVESGSQLFARSESEWQLYQIVGAPNFAEKDKLIGEVAENTFYSSGILSERTKYRLDAHESALYWGNTQDEVDPESDIYNQGGTDAVDRTVVSKLQEIVSVKDFGAVGDGVTDDTDAIQNAIQYCSDNKLKLYIPGGQTYLITEISITGGYYVDICGDPGNKPIIISTSAAAAAGARQFEFFGSADVTGLTLAADINTNERTITLDDVTGLSVGMVMRITSEDTLWPYDNRGIYYKGEIHEIIDVDTGSNTVGILDSTRDTYLTSENLIIEAWTPNVLSLEDLEFQLPDGVSTGCVTFTHAKNANIHNIIASGATFFHFLDYYCINTNYSNLALGPTTDNGTENGYGVSDRSSLGTTINGLKTERLRAAYDSHSLSGAGSVPNRDASVSNFVIRGGGPVYPDSGEESRGLGMHGPSEGLRFANGFIVDVLQGIRVRGKDTFVESVSTSGLINTFALCTHGTGLQIRNCSYNSFNYPNKGVTTPVSGSGLLTFANMGLDNTAGNQWDYSSPVILESNTVQGGTESFVEFIGPNEVSNFYINNNLIEATPGAGNTYYLLYRNGPQTLVKGSVINNNLINIDGSVEVASSGLDIGGPSSETYPAVKFDSRQWVIRLADDTVGQIFLDVLTSVQERPVMVIAADAGGTAIFQMRKENATLTIYSGTFVALSATATPTSLNGTGGTDGNLTLGLTNEGILYVENRTATTRTYRIALLS